MSPLALQGKKSENITDSSTILAAETFPEERVNLVVHSKLDTGCELSSAVWNPCVLCSFALHLERTIYFFHFWNEKKRQPNVSISSLPILIFKHLKCGSNLLSRRFENPLLSKMATMSRPSSISIPVYLRRVDRYWRRSLENCLTSINIFLWNLK